MLNTIHEGDRIIASRLAYDFNDPERYDIIIFRFPDNEDEFFVKRIIGLPGETVNIKDGIVYVTKEDGKTIQLDDSFVTIRCLRTAILCSVIIETTLRILVFGPQLTM